MVARVECYTAGMSREEAYAVLTANSDEEVPKMSGMVAESALRVAREEGAWWSPRLAILHFHDGFAIVEYAKKR